MGSSTESKPVEVSALTIEQQLAQELKVQLSQVSATVALMDEGATVPFIARYRKEATGGLDDIQLRELDKRLVYLRELHERREAIIKSIDNQGKLTAELQVQIEAAQNKTDLEDLYLPYKPKRQTKAQKARDAGLEPLLASLLGDSALDPKEQAASFIDAEKNLSTVEKVLEGVRHILMDDLNNNAVLVKQLRQQLAESARITVSLSASCADKKNDKKVVHFSDYFEHDELFAKMPSHRALAVFRGRSAGVLQLKIDLPQAESSQKVRDLPVSQVHPLVAILEQSLQLNERPDGPNKAWLKESCLWAWKVKLHPRLETELLSELKSASDGQAIDVFATNLKHLLLAPPAGNRVTLGLDPGLRTGVKIALVGSSGEAVTTDVIFPHEPKKQWDASLATLKKLVVDHKVELVAIGNGTASRETASLVSELLNDPDVNATKVVVSEAGASIYSASELASKELPGMDVSYRGAVSIARRLQDPLAELVKIESKSIGVGQYQHDVDQVMLNKSLEGVVEDCVNSVGVDINTASAPLLTQVSGVNTTLAQNIVMFREKQGPFTSRESLKSVPRFGERTFEQAAGFIRVPQSVNPLDASSVHPEAYSLVELMATTLGVPVKELIGNSEALKALNPAQFVTEKFGLPTITDILAELEKPGRDPRQAFKVAQFRDDVKNVSDLTSGMVLEGVVTNVTHFGAFVDIGVHQEGLVHISELSDTFVKDPSTVVKAGDIVKVRVLEIEPERNRVALSMKSPSATSGRRGERDRATTDRNALRSGSGKPASKSHNSGARKGRVPGKSYDRAKGGQQQSSPPANNAFANAFAKAKQRSKSE